MVPVVVASKSETAADGTVEDMDVPESFLWSTAVTSMGVAMAVAGVPVTIEGAIVLLFDKVGDMGCA